MSEENKAVNCANCLSIFDVPIILFNNLIKDGTIIVKENLYFSKDCPKCSIDYMGY